MADTSALTIGLVHNWPGAKNSELDIIIRVQSILESLGHSSQIVDPLGHPLNQLGDKIGVDSKTTIAFDLVLNFHYLNPAFLTGLSYVVNWNPLAYLIDSPITKKPLPIKQLSYLVDCLRSHDRVLSASSVIVDDYAAAARVNVNRPWLAETQLCLHTSIESEGAKPLPEWLDPARLKVFYIGVNWEKLSQDKDRQVRHDGLFETLDQSGQFEFYGLREQYGIPLWQGIDSYKGELPFDGGISITEKARQCGATLVLSSDQHRASALVSTRIFQACKAGAIIITDRNVFIEQHFASAVLYFDYGHTPQQTAQNILQQVNWIKQNWQQAKEKAALAQTIFVEKFALEKEVSLICRQAVIDVKAKQNCLAALSPNKVVVLYYAVEFNEAAFVQCLDNIARQTHSHIELLVCAVSDVCNRLEAVFKASKIDLQTSFVSSNYHQSLGCWLTDSQLDKGDYFLLYSPGFVWHTEHIFRLLSECVNNKNSVAFSPLFVWHDSLNNSADTMDPFIKGLDGGSKPFSLVKLVDFEWQHFPLGNLLISGALFDVSKEDALLIRQFNLAALFVLLLLKMEGLAGKTGNVSNISSQYEVDSSSVFFEFDEYHALGVASSDYKQRDRNALGALLRYINKDALIPKLEEKLIFWEAEQLDGQLGASSAAYQSHKLSRQVAVLQKQMEHVQSPQFSQQLSLKVYLKHVLRNRPRLLRLSSKFARILQRIVKI